MARTLANAGSSPPARFTAHVSQRVRVLFNLLRAAWQEYERDYARYFAVAMIFYTLMSLVPLLLLLLAGLGLLLRRSEVAAATEQRILIAIQNGFGVDLRTTVEHLLQGLQQQSVVTSIISLAGLMLTASILVHHLRLSFRAIWKQPPILVSGSIPVVIWGALREKALAFGMVLAGGVVLLLTFVAITGINWMTARFMSAWELELVLPICLILVPLTFALLFKYLPPSPLPWRHVWLAALLCGGTFIVAVEILALYGAFFGKNLNAYGAVGAILVVMLWMKAVSQGLYFGAELCKVIAQLDSAQFPAANIHGA
jgi:membrane protein